jgi:hypothetical protein
MSEQDYKLESLFHRGNVDEPKFHRLQRTQCAGLDDQGRMTNIQREGREKAESEAVVSPRNQ